MRTILGIDITDINDIKDAHSRSGGNWFSASTMKYWNTRVHSAIYGGTYFVSSDADYSSARVYTVRRIDSDGSISTVGDFGAYATSKQAHKAAKALADKL